MYSLIMGFWHMFFKKQQFQVLIVGLDYAGKTTILEQIKSIFSGMEPLPPGKIPPTVGLNIARARIDRSNLIFWDLGGARSLRSLWERYYGEAHGLLFVVDASDVARLDEAREVLQSLLQHQELTGIPLLVFANKQDAAGALSPHEVQARFGLEQADGSSQPQTVLGTSAIRGDGVEEGVRWMVETLLTSPRALALQSGG